MQPAPFTLIIIAMKIIIKGALTLYPPIKTKMGNGRCIHDIPGPTEETVPLEDSPKFSCECLNPFNGTHNHYNRLLFIWYLCDLRQKSYSDQITLLSTMEHGRTTVCVLGSLDSMGKL